MPRGLLTLKQHLQSVKEKSWVSASTYAGSFNGTNQYLIKTGGTNLAGDFTLEYWMCATAYGNYPTTFSNFNAASGSLTLYAQFGPSSASFSFNCGNGTGDGGIGSTTLLLNTWYHHAVVRSGSTVTAYVNGVSVGTRTSSATLPVDVLGIGAYCGPLAGSYPFSGFITNFRIVNGTAVYTGAFTPPLRELVAITNTQLLTLQGTTIVDTSATANAIANNGTVTTIRSFPFAEFKTPAVDYLVVAGGGAGGGSYGSGGGAGGLLQGSLPVTAGSAITVTVGAGGTGVAGAAGNAGNNSILGTITTIGGGYGVSGYGTQAGSGGSGGGGSGNASGHGKWGQPVFGQGNRGGDGGDGTGPAQGGGGGAGTQGLDGIGEQPAGAGGAGIASAITGTITGYAGGGGGGCYARSTAVQGAGGFGGGGAGGVSTATNNGTAGTANTGGGGGGGSFVTSGNPLGGNGGSGIVIISYPDTYAGAAATTGSPVVSTSGSGSIAFSGTSQYITTVSASALAFNANNFTVEGFVYFNSIGTTGAPKGVLQLSAASTGINAAVGNSVALGSNATSGRWEIYAGATSTVAASAAPVANTWYHFAIVKNSGTTVLYINGTSVLSVADSTTYTGTYLAIGAYYVSGYGIPGYVSNLRVVNGVAVYTGAFTPPITPLTTTQSAGTNISAITGTSTALLLNTISGAQFADSSTNSYTLTQTGTPTWNQASPFATGLGYKNRVYTYTASGTITF